MEGTTIQSVATHGQRGRRAPTGIVATVSVSASTRATFPAVASAAHSEPCPGRERDRIASSWIADTTRLSAGETRRPAFDPDPERASLKAPLRLLAWRPNVGENAMRPRVGTLSTLVWPREIQSEPSPKARLGATGA